MFRNLHLVIAGGVLALEPRAVLTLYHTGGWALASTDGLRPTTGTYTYDSATGALVLTLEGGEAYGDGILDGTSGVAQLVAYGTEFILAPVESY